MKRISVALANSVLLAGCAVQPTSDFSYSPASTATANNEKVVSKTQAVVWDELVRELSKSFYVINNIERESRIINVSFNSNSPGDYVDCGRTVRTYTKGDKKEMYSYALTEKNMYKTALKSSQPQFITYAIVHRDPSLEGRANIYVAPAPSDPSRTVVSVNTRYILSIKVAGDQFAENVYGQVVNRAPIREQSQSFIFSTNQPSTTTNAGMSVVCAGKGKLENEILNMVR